MPLGTLDRSPPPFFKQGPSALSKLVFFSALAVFMMVADARLGLSGPARSALASVLYPLQWLSLQPGRAGQALGDHLANLEQAQKEAQTARQELTRQLLRAGQVEQLSLENRQLRQLLELREQLAPSSRAAEIVYEAADPYSRKVVLNKGALAGIERGSPVIDANAVIGQVTRVHPLSSEVTLVIDRELSIPVLNPRTGVRSVAYGEPALGVLELRFMASNADIQVGDLLTTSGVDGVYPPGLPVARVSHIERRAESTFARIHCEPLAQVAGARHVLVLTPLQSQRPPEAAAPAPEKAAPKAKGGRP
jgi:rod shape-determining protein MreC